MSVREKAQEALNAETLSYKKQLAIAVIRTLNRLEENKVIDLRTVEDLNQLLKDLDNKEISFEWNFERSIYTIGGNIVNANSLTSYSREFNKK